MRRLFVFSLESACDNRMKSLIQSEAGSYCIENDGTITQIVRAEKYFTLPNLPGDKRPERLASLSDSGIVDVIQIVATDSTHWLMLIYSEQGKTAKLLQITA